jgi:O-antigen ligase
MLVAVIAAAVVGLNPILERFTKKWLRSSGRPEFSAVAGEITKNFPAAGTGPGTFVYAYQFFEKKSDGTLLRHAHNDYLEIPAESGIVGGAVLVALAFGALGVLFWKWLERRDSLPKGIGLGCMVGIIAILIHSVADFNLRIPSNAVYFLTLYALGMKAVMTKGKRHGED